MDDAVDGIGIDPACAELTTIARLIGHYQVVARIFAGPLAGKPHGFTADNFAEAVDLSTLAAGQAEVDHWYCDYLETVTEQQLAEPLPFTFTDGDKGLMTRAEMLMHAALHAGYHRGVMPSPRGIPMPSICIRRSQNGAGRAHKGPAPADNRY